MSIKMGDGVRIAFDITPETTPEEKQAIMRCIKSAREADEEKSQFTKAIIPEAPKDEPKSEVQKVDIGSKDDKPVFSLPFSKRIAAIISILLCITLYLTFLTTGFSSKRDTYICYTTKTGECYHSATCSYLNTAYETTVYEACHKYKPCKHCNPCVEKYETTITERNYIVPLLISSPISVAVFFLLTYKKKN